MGRRLRNIRDITITEKDLARLTKHNRLYRMIEGKVFCIYVSSATSKRLRKIKNLEQQLESLRAEAAGKGKRRTKRAYRKKDLAFWDKGGNVRHLRMGKD